MLKTAKVVALNSDTAAAQALLSHNEGKGNFFAIATCHTDDAFTRARQALLNAEAVFFNLDEEPDESLSLSERLNRAFLKIQSDLQDTDNVQILVVAIDQEQEKRILYLFHFGGGVGAYLFREGEMNNLCQIVSESQLLSGFLTQGDRLLLTTESFKNVWGQDLTTVSSPPLDELEEEITSRLPQAQVYPLAVIVIEEERILNVSPESAVAPAINEISDQEHLSKSPASSVTGHRDLKISIPFNKKMITLLVIIVAVIGGLFAGISLFQKLVGSKVLDQATNAVPPQGNSADVSMNTNINQLETLSPWLDLELLKKGFTANRMSLSLKKILLLDNSSKTLTAVTLASKSQQVLAGQDKLGDALIASLNGEIAWVYTSDRGIVKIDSTTQAFSKSIAKDEEWGVIEDIYGFASNLYILDRTNNQVWKYVPIESGYAEKRPYFKEGVSPDLSQAKRMHIDSSVWILTGGNKLLKFTQGGADHYALQGLGKPLSDLSTFFVSDQTDKVYLLDRGNNRVVVTEKDGKYVNEYQGSNLLEAEDLIVDEENKKMYLLINSKIVTTDLK